MVPDRGHVYFGEHPSLLKNSLYASFGSRMGP